MLSVGSSDEEAEMQQSETNKTVPPKDAKADPKKSEDAAETKPVFRDWAMI